VTSNDAIVSEWNSRRKDLAGGVDKAVKTVNPRLCVKGSFRRGDFHLLRDGSASFSDVDLLLEPDGRNRHDWEEDVEIALIRLGWRLRVSVQHFDSLKGIGSSDSLLLTFGELIRFFPRCSDQRFAAYLYSKTTLSMLRCGPHRESQHTLVQYPGAYSRARLARVGLHAQFGIAESRILLEALAAASPAVGQHLELMGTGDVRAARDWFIPRLMSSSVHPWLKERLRLLVQGSPA